MDARTIPVTIRPKNVLLPESDPESVYRVDTLPGVADASLIYLFSHFETALFGRDCRPAAVRHQPVSERWCMGSADMTKYKKL